MEAVRTLTATHFNFNVKKIPLKAPRLIHTRSTAQQSSTGRTSVNCLYSLQRPAWCLRERCIEKRLKKSSNCTVL